MWVNIIAGTGFAIALIVVIADAFKKYRGKL